MPLRDRGLGHGWSVSASNLNGLIKAQAICDFAPQPDRLVHQLIEWLKERGRQLQRATPTIVGAAATRPPILPEEPGT